MSHRSDSKRVQNWVFTAWIVLGLSLFAGLVVKAFDDYPSQPHSVSVEKTVPVRAYGPSDTSSLEDFYAQLFAPEDRPVDCQPSTGEPLADLMLGITAC